MGNRYIYKKYLWYIHSNIVRALKKKIQNLIEHIYLDPFFYKLGVLKNNSILDVIGFLCTSYRIIVNTNMKKYVLMMNLYDVEKTFEALMNKIYKGHTYEVLVGQEMSDTILIFKAVTLLANIAMLNQDICE